MRRSVLGQEMRVMYLKQYVVKEPQWLFIVIPAKAKRLIVGGD